MTTGSFFFISSLTFLLPFVFSFDELHFLKQYGYIPATGNAQLGSDVVADALKIFQKAYGLDETGVLDRNTAAAMREPRCAAPDIESPGRRRRKRNEGRRWDRRELSYAVTNWSHHLSAGQVEHTLRKATSVWAEIGDFSFSRAAKPDVEIRFGVDQHNCSARFDPFVLAHTFPPTDGSMHFNDRHVWKDQEVSDSRGISFYSVAIHEWGHALGLGHNLDEPNSIMSPRELHRKGVITERDKYMLKMLYGTLKRGEKAPERPKTTSTTGVPPTTRPTSTERPDPCTSGADAVGTFRGEFIVFKDEWLWRVSREGRVIQRPEKISFLLPQVSFPVNAAVEVNDDLWIFSEQKIFVVNVGSSWLQLKHSPLGFTDIGLPRELKRIRLAYKWKYFSPPAIYLWGEEEYWRLNLSERRVEATYPRPIERNWRHVPRRAQAAFNRDGELHFLVDNHVYRMNTSDYRLPVEEGYPIDIDRFWQSCTPSAPPVLPSVPRPPSRFSRSSSEGSRHSALHCVILVVLLMIF